MSSAPLYEQAPPDLDVFTLDEAAVPFCLEQRATDLLHQCAVLCEMALDHVKLPTPSGDTRSMTWSDLDEIILAGGAGRIPMVPRMLERLSKRRVLRHIDGFSYDTVIAMGAALYSHN
jgi:molecular chaperone DnaK